MKTLWPAATLTLAVTGYFAWASMGASPAPELQIEDCHRLAGQVSAIHTKGGTIPDDLLGTARRCSVTFGQNWAASGGEQAAALRAEGAQRVN